MLRLTFAVLLFVLAPLADAAAQAAKAPTAVITMESGGEITLSR